MTESGMRFPGFVRLFVLTVTFVASFALFGQSRSFAESMSGWAVSEVSGDVRVRLGEGPWTDLATGDVLVADSEIETANGGRVVLKMNGDVITVSPNSRMTVPNREAGSSANILQSLGTLLFKMETRPERGFRVETPVLAAAIKGTTFTVTVSPEGAGLHVVEGSVEVTAMDSGEVALVYPGQTATLAAVAGASLSIIQGRQSEFRKQNQNGNQNAAGGNDAPVTSASARTQPNSGGKSALFRGFPRIGKALGGTRGDISALSDGLIADAGKGHKQAIGKGTSVEPKGNGANSNSLNANQLGGPGATTGNGFSSGGLGAINGNGGDAGGKKSAVIVIGGDGTAAISAIASQGQGQGQGQGQSKGKVQVK